MMKRLLIAVAMLCAISDAQVSVAPILQPHQTFVDQSGAPCAGCSLYSYTAGTTIPTPTYADAGGGTQNPNPIVLSVQGGANIWVNDALSYKFALKNAQGSTVWTVDYVKFPTPDTPPPPEIDCVALHCVITNPTNSQSITQPSGTYTNLNAPALVNNFLTTGTAQTVRAWGTSQTQGFGIDGCFTLICHPAHSYPQLFANQMGWTMDNQGYGSSQCADLAYSGTSESMWGTGAMAITTNSRNIYGHIRNDQKNGIFPYQLDYARGCIQAEMAWLAIPEQGSAIPGPGKLRASGNGCVKLGTWVDGGINEAESVATSAGASMECTVTGKTIYVAAARVFGSTAVYSILIDGVGVYDPITRGTTFDQTMTVPPVSGFPVSSNVTPDLIRAPGQTDQTHTITVNCITPGPLGCMFFYVAGVSTDNSTANGPFVYSISTFYNDAAHQTGQFTPQFTNLYQSQWRRAVDELQSDGLQVVALDVTNPQVYNSLDPTQVQSDGIHPTAAGTTVIAAGLVSKATSAATPADRAEVKIPNATSAYDCFGSGPNPSPSGGGNTNLSYLIPAGCIWSSTGGQTGRWYAGTDGTSFLERFTDQATNANQFGIGHLWILNEVDGLQANFVAVGQVTSDVAGVDNGGVVQAKNGSNTSQDIMEGSNGNGVTNWPNNALLTTNRNRVINADAGHIYFQLAHTGVADFSTASALFTVPIKYSTFDVPVTSSPAVGQAACIKAAGPPPVIGFCTTAVSAGGACTCN